MPKPVYKEGEITVLWNPTEHTDREVTANRPDIIIKNKKRENMHTDRCGNTGRQKCCAKGSGKEVKTQEFMYRDTTNVEPEKYDYTSNNCSHWNRNEKLKKKSGSCTEKTFDRFSTKDSCTGNSTHSGETAAVWNLKPERRGSPLVQGKCREDKTCDKG
jgi:hypothetical protein